MSKVHLKLDWCSYEAAKYAVEHWHYSKDLSAARNAYIGVWEDSMFIGAVVFGIGSGGATDGRRFGLARSHQMAELTRVALNKHKSPVSKIISIAIRMIKKQSPGVRLIVSMADPAQKHIGAIYQAGNWIYTGQTVADYEYQLSDGRWVHHRTASSAMTSIAGRPKRRIQGKYRYLMPLDDEMRKRIEPLRKPYPKRALAEIETGGVSNVESGGANPTNALTKKSRRVPSA